MNLDTLAFAGSGLDRAAELRNDEAALAELAAAPGSCALLFWRGKPLITGEAEIVAERLPMSHPVLSDISERVFLGRDGSAGIFAFDLGSWTPEDTETAPTGGFLDLTEQRHPDLPKGSRFAELRQIMMGLSARDAELLATGKSLLGWHRSHRYCSQCGHESQMSSAGWQRKCPACGAAHFPRTDPVVIMLITHGNSTLLGRSPGWPEGMYSCLAGFVEPGETLEAAVRREVMEETQVKVGPVSYLASQPWAFPSSLMFGCTGRAETTQITIDPHEIEDARWVTREDLMRAMYGESDWLKPARKGSIAHTMLQNWLADSLD